MMTRPKIEYRLGNAPAYFIPLIPEDLHASAVSASCLDDQWIDCDTLLSQSANFRRRYTKKALEEFAKCLLSARQVVINRSYLQNTEVMKTLVPERDPTNGVMPPMVRFVNDGSVVPYLFSDRDPALEDTAQSGTIADDAISAWNRVCERATPQCVRLSWDEADNVVQRQTQLSDRFVERLELATSASPDCLEQLSRHPSKEEIKAFGAFLATTFRDSIREHGTRKSLYEKFVIRNGTKVAQTKIDQHKPFAREVKQILDLVYNGNMASALEVNSITPSKSISADLFADTALAPSTSKFLTIEHAADLLARVTHTQQKDFDLTAWPMLGSLSMESIVVIRDEPCWASYVDAAAALSQIDTSADDAAFDSSLMNAFATTCDSAEKLLNYLYKYHGVRRRRHDFARRIIAQVGSTILSAGINQLVPIGNELVRKGTSAILKNIAGRPIRALGARYDLLGGSFASLRFPSMRFDHGKDTMVELSKELTKRRFAVDALTSDQLQTPTTEAEAAT